MREKNSIPSVWLKLYKNHTAVVYSFVAVLVLATDYITGRHIEFPILYALPVGLAAWRQRRATAYLMAFFLPAVRVGFIYPWQEVQFLPTALVNAPITALALLCYAYLIERTSWQTLALEKKVKVLEGILPICASCKKIRNEKGEYEQMEKYVTEHSEAEFSHGLCMDCAKKLYPAFFEDQKGKI